ncbi:MAG: hypothetical protein JXA52_06020, partial [Planctomycetes bacterium]|nr:hypothetical protein [Planctomycetota bacterium]
VRERAIMRLLQLSWLNTLNTNLQFPIAGSDESICAGSSGTITEVLLQAESKRSRTCCQGGSAILSGFTAET